MTLEKPWKRAGQQENPKVWFWSRFVKQKKCWSAFQECQGSHIICVYHFQKCIWPSVTAVWWFHQAHVLCQVWAFWLCVNITYTSEYAKWHLEICVSELLSSLVGGSAVQKHVQNTEEPDRAPWGSVCTPAENRLRRQKLMNREAKEKQ